MDQELINKINLSNCYDDVFYKDEWLIDKKTWKCPSNNKYLCKEFNKRNPKIPYGWFDRETDERYYCIEVRHARCEFNSDTYFEMENHCLDQIRYHFLKYIEKCFKCILELEDELYESEEENLQFISFIIEKILNVYSKMENFLYYMFTKKTQIHIRLYEHIDYFIEKRNKELKEYLMYLSLKNDINRRNDTYIHYHHYERGDDYYEDMHQYVRHKVRILGMFIKDLEDVYSDIKFCNKNLCYCIFEINKYL